MKKPSKRRGSLSFTEVKFVDIVMVEVMQKGITKAPPSKTENQNITYKFNKVSVRNNEDPHPL
jgi:hypothetical protein